MTTLNQCAALTHEIGSATVTANKLEVQGLNAIAICSPLEVTADEN